MVGPNGAGSALLVDSCALGGVLGTVCLPVTLAVAGIKCCEPEVGVCYDAICSRDVDPDDYNTPITGDFEGTHVTFGQAENECRARGRRLCSAAELRTRVCCSHGCRMDAHFAWSATDCR